VIVPGQNGAESTLGELESQLETGSLRQGTRQGQTESRAAAVRAGPILPPEGLGEEREVLRDQAARIVLHD
jgi:hypothetical protein